MVVVPVCLFPGEFIFSTPDFTDLSYIVAPQMAVFARKAWQKIDVAGGTSGIEKESKSNLPLEKM